VVQNGTHFRVVVGYDDVADTISMYDPWDRANEFGDLQPRLFTISSEHMCSLWQYQESNGPLVYGGYFGAAMVPWTVQLSYDETVAGHLAVTAFVSYTCPPVFNCSSAPVASNVSIVLSLPPQLSLVNGTGTVEIDMWGAGSNTTVVWLAQEDESYFPSTDAGPSYITVQAFGVVSGSIPEYVPFYPAYNYSDIIGGFAHVQY
jgi:hypothetical protein